MKLWKRILSIIMMIVLCLTMAPISGFKEFFTYKASASTYNVCVSSLQPIDFDRYTGNMGDSFFYSLNQQGLIDSEHKYCRNGNIGVDESVYENGFEVWIARWNNISEISWATISYDIGGAYDTLTGNTGLIKSYNTDTFNTTLYFYGDDQLLHSQVLTNRNYNFNFNINVKGVDKLTILMQDNVAECGGTSFALYDLFLHKESAEKFEKQTLIDKYGFSSQKQFISCLGTDVKSYPADIYGIISMIDLDINNDNTDELIVLRVSETADKREACIIAEIYRSDGNNLSLCASENIYTVSFCTASDIYLFYSSTLKKYCIMIDSQSSGSYTGVNSWSAKVYTVSNNSINNYGYWESVPFSGIEADFQSEFKKINVPYAKYCTEYDVGNNTSYYQPLCEIEHVRYGDSNLESAPEAERNHKLKIKNTVDTPDDSVSISTFNKNIYKADLWLNLNTDKENTAEHVIVNNILSSIGNMSDNFMKEIESDKGFMFNISWTEKADAFFNITDGVHKKAVGKKDLYEVLLFDMMKQKLTGAEFEQNFLADMIDASKNVENVFSATVTVSGAPFELGKDFMKLKNKQINIDDYSKALFTDPAISKTFDSVDDVGLIVGNIVKFADTIEDFYTKMSAYIAAKNMSDELKTFFMEIKNNADDKHLADAAEELVRASASILDALNIATEDAAFDASFQAAGVLADIFTGALLKIPGLNIIVLIYEGLGAINEVTKMLSESICASESNRNNYYLIKATAELCNTAKKATQALADDYIENRTETNALNFIEAINMYSILKAIDCKSSITFFNSVCNEGIINKNIKMNCNALQFLGWDIENPREEEFAQLCEIAESLMESAQQQLYFLSSSWLLNDCNLKTDYPEMYNYYIKRELKYPQYTDSYKPQLYSAKLTNDFALKLRVNSIANIHGIEIREYSDKSKDTLLNTYDVPNEKTIVYKTPDKKNNFPRTYSVAGYFEGGEGTDVDKFYTTESSSKTVGDFKPYIFYIQSDYETKSAKIMIFDNSSSDLDIVYHIYRREDDGNFNKIITIDKNTGLLGWVNIYEDHDLKEDVVYSYCVKSEISFTNGVKLYSDMSNGMAIMLTPPVDDEVRVELEVSDNVTPETSSDNQEKPENLAAAIRPLSFSNQENSENIMSLSNTAKTDASAPYGLRLSWKASKNASGCEIFRKSSYSEIYTSIGVTYKNSFTDYNISSGATYDYMVVEFSETQDEKIYLSNRVSETIDCSSLSIFSDSETADDDSAPVNLKLIFIIAASITVVVFAVGITVIVLITKRNKKNKIAGNNNNSQVPKT